MLNKILKFTITFIIAAYSPIAIVYIIVHKMPATIKLCELLGANLVFGVIAYFLAMLLAKKSNPTSVIIFGCILFTINIVSLVKTI